MSGTVAAPRRSSLAERAAAAAARVLPLRAVARRAAGGTCLLPYYHVVSDRWLPHISPLYRFRDPATFRADLDLLLRFFRPLELPEFLAGAERGSFPRDAMLLTFDDGFREVHEVVAPILRAKGVSAVFFLTSATLDNRLLCAHQQIALLLDRLARGVSPAVRAELRRLIPGAPADLPAAVRALGREDGALLERIALACDVDFAGFLARQRPYLSTAEARALLAGGFHLGAHSIDHPRYADLTLAEQLRQTRESMDVLQARLGLAERVFAFPHSDQGVAATFFNQLAAHEPFAATFGTSAPAREPIARHFQRFSLEKAHQPAAAVLAHQALRRAKLGFAGPGRGNRPR